MQENILTRRTILAGAGVLLAGGAKAAPSKKLKVSIFSKHLQFVQGDEMARTAAELGFDAVDITVRKGGHIEPEKARQELPVLAGIIRRRGLEVSMITTDIADTSTVFAEDILRTMQDLGIRYYRWGGFTYKGQTPILQQLDALKPRVAKLAEMNAKYGVCAMYHTHSGVNLVGASFWDLQRILEGTDAKLAGVNYDVAHATVEGGLGGWINNFRVIEDHLRGFAVKDFAWGKNAKGVWEPVWCPLGAGMVKFADFFKMIGAAGFDGPVQMHFEYEMGGPETTKAAMKKDLTTLRGYLAQAGL